MAVKEGLAMKYKTRYALKLPPHITMQIPFWWKKEDEGRLLAGLNEFAHGQKPFDEGLDGFGCFRPKVFFIKTSKKNKVTLS